MSIKKFNFLQFSIKKIFLSFLAIITIVLSSKSQTVLNADNTPNNTYELINSVLAPGYTAVESPDQASGTHPSFGRHIAEVFDADLNKNVFEFYSHVAEDNDVSGGLVRQRVEIKTYASSPANLKGVMGETVVYKWRFKIPVGFQPSSNFTHIHQVKAVDGDDGDPIFTLTPRKGTPNKLELIYVKDQYSGTDKKAIVNLSLFEGIWVEATETIKIGLNGTYALSIVKVSDGTAVLTYANSDIQTVRTDNSFIRPKWGIYRSLATPSDLRDESIRFSDISINEIVTLPVNISYFTAQKQSSVVQLKWITVSEQNNSHFDIQISVDGINFSNIGKVNGAGNSNTSLDYSFTDKTPASGVNYYRLSQVDFDGKTMLSNPVLVNMGFINSTIHVFAIPHSTNLNINISLEQASSGQLVIYDLNGRKVFQQEVTLNKGNNDYVIGMFNADKGVFIATYYNDNQLLKIKFIR